jgi:hypothetical protein
MRLRRYALFAIYVHYDQHKSESFLLLESH